MVRARIEAVMARLRGKTAAWSAKEAALWKVVIPQMADWLPPEERDAARAEFAALMRRLETP